MSEASNAESPQLKGRRRKISVIRAHHPFSPSSSIESERHFLSAEPSPPTSPQVKGMEMGNRTASFSSLLSTKEDMSRSIADLPSRLNEIFSMPFKERNLKSMKSLARSCADLRRCDESSPEPQPKSPISPLASPFPSTRRNVDFQKPHRFPPDYFKDYRDEKEHYQTIHPLLPNKLSPCSPPSGRPNYLAMRPSLPKVDNSISDSEDETYGIYGTKGCYKPPSPTRKSGQKTRMMGSSSGRLTDDPVLLLKAKLKETHSLCNLAEKELGGFRPNPLTLPSHPPLGGYSEVYHTVHGMSPGNRPDLKEMRNNFLGFTSRELEERLEESTISEDEYIGRDCSYNSHQGYSRRSGTPSSCGYKTMRPYTLYTSISAYNDPGLLRFLKEKERGRQAPYYNMVRRVPGMSVLLGMRWQSHKS